MNPKKGLATWAGLVAALGQYAAAVAVFLEADNQSDALAPLVTATATLLAVVVGRMQQAKALAAKPAAVSFSTPMTSTSANALVSAVTSAVSGGIGGQVGLGYTTPTGTTAYAYPSDDEPGDPDALPDYQTETDPPPDEGDTSANGDTGERPA